MKIRKKIMITSVGILFLVFLLSTSIVNGKYTPKSSEFIQTNDPTFYEDTSLNAIKPDEECLVPCDQIYTGQSKDGIPSIDYPNFISIDNEASPDDSQIVIGVVIDGEARAYPYNILNWHEIVNDVFNGQHFSITYCPLTGSGLLFNTNIIDDSEVGTSGKLYENNLVFYDRVSDSWWSQMLSQSIKGSHIGENISYSKAMETTWGAWKRLYPDTIVLSEETGYYRNYQRYPYGNYRDDSTILFPTTYNKNIAPYNLYQEKVITQVLKLNNEVLLLPFEELNGKTTINYNFAGEQIVTFYNEENRLAITYETTLSDGTTLSFSPYTKNDISESLTMGLPVFIDNENNEWNIKGVAIKGSRIGTELAVIPTYNAFWFAASTFFHNANIFVSNGDGEFQSFSFESFSVEPKVQKVGFLNATPLYFVAFALLIITIPRLTRKFN